MGGSGNFTAIAAKNTAGTSVGGVPIIVFENLASDRSMRCARNSDGDVYAGSARAKA